MTAGAGTLRLRSLACAPITAVSSSRTTLISAWPGVSDLQHFLADRAHLDALDQRLHDRQRDVGFQQRDAHFAQRFADVLLGQAAAAAQAGDGAGETLGEGFEHGPSTAMMRNGREL